MERSSKLADLTIKSKTSELTYSSRTRTVVAVLYRLSAVDLTLTKSEQTCVPSRIQMCVNLFPAFFT